MRNQDEESKLGLLDGSEEQTIAKTFFVVGVMRDNVPHIFTEGFLQNVASSFNIEGTTLRDALLKAPMYHDKKTAARYISFLTDDVTPGQLLDGEVLKPIPVADLFGYKFTLMDNKAVGYLVTKETGVTLLEFVREKIQYQRDGIASVLDKTVEEVRAHKAKINGYRSDIGAHEKVIMTYQKLLARKPAKAKKVKKAKKVAKRKATKKKARKAKAKPKAASRRKKNVRSNRGRSRRR